MFYLRFAIILSIIKVSTSPDSSQIVLFFRTDTTCLFEGKSSLIMIRPQIRLAFSLLTLLLKSR